MKKFLFAITLSLFFCKSYSMVPLYLKDDLEKCREQGREFGDGKGHKTIDDDCFRLVKEWVPPDKTFQSFDKKISAFGIYNLLFIYFYKADKIVKISGEQSLLHDIKSIDLDLEIGHIVVYDRYEKSILTFDMYNPGNIAPLYVLSFKKLDKGMFDRVFFDKKYIYATSLKNKSVSQFFRKGSIYNKDKDGSVNLIKTFKFKNLVKKDIMDIFFYRKFNELYILSKDGVLLSLKYDGHKFILFKKIKLYEINRDQRYFIDANGKFLTIQNDQREIILELERAFVDTNK
jgi:hypothetical protein